MKHLLNVLYVVTEDSYLCKEGETICVRVGGEEKVRVPAHTLESIVCFGHTTVSTPLIGFLGERGIGLAFLSPEGRFYGRVEGPVHGNVLLRKAQYAAASDDRRMAALACGQIMSKIANTRNVLLRAARDQPANEQGVALGRAAKELAGIAQQLEPVGGAPVTGINTLRGLEGAAGAVYWGVFDHMIRTNRDDFYFRLRSRRPPLDNMNALLSFSYALLANDVRSALESVGLDPAAGFLHTLRPGRPALALDLMEELRAWFCDRFVLSLVNLRQVQGSDFEHTATGVLLKEPARRTFIAAWQKRKREEIVHPFVEERIPIGLIPFVQAQLLARHLRGDLDAYPPFYWK
jgi:CRISP-associated protein Cas1